MTTVEPKTIRILDELVAAHDDGCHEDRPRTGCPSSFGEALRARREASRLTQTELAAITGISQSYICKLENDLGQDPRPVYRYALRVALGVTEDADGGWWRTDW